MGGWTGYGIYQAAGLAIPMGFLEFSRGFESEADMLGLQYMYKAGYDPTAFVDFFEKIQSLEKRKPGTMSKVFSTHPPTDDRIKAAQKNIQEYLKAKPEYVVSTSEFNDVKARVMAMHNRRQIDESEGCRPAHAAPQSERPDRFQRQRKSADLRFGRSADTEASRYDQLSLLSLLHSNFQGGALQAALLLTSAMDGSKPSRASYGRGAPPQYYAQAPRHRLHAIARLRPPRSVKIL